MTGQDLAYFREWFSNYIKSFYTDNEEDQKNIMAKVYHTEQVCQNIDKIVTGLGLDENLAMLAGTVALFHDIGRFRQYAEYKTFMDKKSVSHGMLGAKVLLEENVLKNISRDEQETICKVIRFHGAFAIPTTYDERTVLLLKLVRDADKLDIYRVFLEYYESAEEDRASAVAFGLKDSDGYSNEVLSCLNENRVASYSDLKNENDFRLLKLSWVYGINFEESLTLLLKKRYLNRIIEKLPSTDEILAAVEHINQYMNQRIENATC